MEQEILQIIKEKLPAIQAQAIADFVKEAEQTKNKCESLKRAAETTDLTIKQITKENAVLNMRIEKVENIEGREKAVKALELQNAVDAQKLQGAEEKVSLVKEMFQVVFANARIKREIFGNIPVPVSDSGSYPTTMQTNSSETITTD